jgi:hypothetical protein
LQQQETHNIIIVALVHVVGVDDPRTQKVKYESRASNAHILVEQPRTWDAAAPCNTA